MRFTVLRKAARKTTAHQSLRARGGHPNRLGDKETTTESFQTGRQGGERGKKESTVKGHGCWGRSAIRGESRNEDKEKPALREPRLAKRRFSSGGRRGGRVREAEGGGASLLTGRTLKSRFALKPVGVNKTRKNRA